MTFVNGALIQRRFGAFAVKALAVQFKQWIIVRYISRLWGHLLWHVRLRLRDLTVLREAVVSRQEECVSISRSLSCSLAIVLFSPVPLLCTPSDVALPPTGEEFPKRWWRRLFLKTHTSTSARRRRRRVFRLELSASGWLLRISQRPALHYKETTALQPTIPTFLSCPTDTRRHTHNTHKTFYSHSTVPCCTVLYRAVWWVVARLC